MKNSIKNILIVSFVVVAGLVFYFVSRNTSNESSMEKTKETTMVTEPTEKETENSMMKKDAEDIEEKMMENKINKSRYAMYSKEVLDGSATSRRVLFFYASWCPTCKPADVSFKEDESSIPEDVTVIRVNYNDPETDQDEKNLAKKYGITYQHTFVQIDEQGNELTKWNGGKITELLSNIK
ncbi:MAG: thioredoxin domain-containing protein [Patescibacteria group bacterium]